MEKQKQVMSGNTPMPGNPMVVYLTTYHMYTYFKKLKETGKSMPAEKKGKNADPPSGAPAKPRIYPAPAGTPRPKLIPGLTSRLKKLKSAVNSSA